MAVVVEPAEHSATRSARRLGTRALVGPQLTQGNPDEAIDLDQLRPATALHHASQLLSKGAIFEHERVTGACENAHGPKGDLQQEEHPGRMRASVRDGKPTRGPELGKD